MKRYLPRLRSLAQAGVRFVVFGSAGLALRHPSLQSTYALPDADLLLAPGLDSVRGFARWAQAAGGRVTCWGEPWDERWGASDLAGKFYTRASVAGLWLDATHESPLLDVPRLIEQADWIEGVPVCPEEDLWFSKLNRGIERGLSFAAEHGLEIPPRALERAREGRG